MRHRRRGDSIQPRGIGKDLVRNVSLALPPVRQWYDQRKAAKGYDAGKDAVEYAQGVFNTHSNAVGGASALTGATVLEIGPGGNVATALLFAQAGAARVVCIDTFPWAKDQPDLYRGLVDDPAGCLRRVEYCCPDSIEETSLLSRSFDVIYSHAVLEHVLDPRAAIASIARLLALGGRTSHQVDLRDHRDFANPLAFLAYSDRVWHAATSRHAPMNRWRAPEWLAVFGDCGLDATIDVTQAVSPSAEDRARMHPRFKRLVTDPEPTGILLTASKFG